MVLFILTREGLEDVRPIIAGNAVWVNVGVLSDQEVDELRATGLDLTRFTIPVDPLSNDEMSEAVYTIAQHHPGQRIWVETHSTTV